MNLFNNLKSGLFKGRYIKQMFEHAVTKWDPVEQEGKFLQVSGSLNIPIYLLLMFNPHLTRNYT